MSLNPLQDIQNEVAQLLTAQPYFNGVSVIAERKGDIVNQIQITLGKIGLCVVIEALTGRPAYQGIGAYSLDLKLGIVVTENVTINQSSAGTRKPAAEVVAMILALLNPVRGVSAYCDSFELVSDANNLLVYLIRCSANAGFQLTAA